MPPCSFLSLENLIRIAAARAWTVGLAVGKDDDEVAAFFFTSPFDVPDTIESENRFALGAASNGKQIINVFRKKA